jgi:hypothetical protein
VLGFGQQCDCMLEIQVEQQRCCPPLQGASALDVVHPRCTIEQELSEQAVVAIDWLRATRYVHEEVTPLQVRQNAGRAHAAGQLLGGLQGEQGQIGSAQQKVLRFLCERAEHLCCEVREHLRSGQRAGHGCGVVPAVLKQEGKACSPSVAVPVHGPHERGVRYPAVSGDLGGFRRGEPQVLPADAQHAAVREWTAKVLGRVCARDADDADAFRRCFDGACNQRMHLRRRRQFVIVVEHERRWDRHARKKVVKEPPGEAGHVLQLVGGGYRQVVALARSQACHRNAQIVEQGCGIQVIAADLIPDAGETPRVQPRRDRGGLAGARRAGHQDAEVPAQGIVEPVE